MTNANECTCPSGDGSLRHPCPAHPVSVEQAGGDERAAFFKHLIGRHPAHETEIVRVVEHNHAAWKAWQARAALAQPSPVRSSLLINGYQLRAALDFIAPDGTAEQLKSEACIEWRQQDADFLEAGLYAFCAEYPEEGGVLLDEEPTTAQPSPLQSEQAEAERPEVVARVVHSNPVVLGQCGPLNANDELMTVAQHAASVARWAEMFNRVEQERDVALARVAELERQEPVDVPGPDEIHQMAFEEGQPAEDGDGYLFSAEEFDLFVQRLLDSCAAPVAQAQHSVPEWTSSKPAVEGAYWVRGNGLVEPFVVLVKLDQGELWCNLHMRNTDTNFGYGYAVDDLSSEFEWCGPLAAATGRSVPQAWLDVQAERRRQVEAEGWTPEHDDEHNGGELADAAACYALSAAGWSTYAARERWPWPLEWWKPSTARRDLVKASALALAEIERLDRAATGKEGV
ncbi:hypothetical protein ACVNNF_11175 [Pseudomonas aeruginosa]